MIHNACHIIFYFIFILCANLFFSEMKAKKFDPELDTEINIGYSMKTYSVNRITKRKHRQAMVADPEMERKTRLGEGMIINPF